MAGLPQTRLGQLTIANNAPQERAGNVRAIEPPIGSAEATGKGYLYLLLELAGGEANHARLYRQMLAAAQSTYYTHTGSITASLAHAVQAAHNVLAESNRQADEMTTGGISLVALKGDEVFIAQAGAALTLVTHPRTVEQFPAGFSERMVTLGGRERPEVEWFQTKVEPQSSLVLLHSGWAEVVPPERLAAAAVAFDVVAALSTLAVLTQGRTLSALVVTVTETGRAAPIVPPLTGQPPAPPPAAAEPHPITEAASDLVAAAGEKAQSAKTKLTQGARDLSERLRQGQDAADTAKPPAKPSARERRPAKTSSPIALYLAILIPLMTLIVVAAVWWQRGQAQEGRYEQLMQQAREGQQMALSQTDAALQRQQMREAYDAVSEALQLRADSAEARTLLRSIEADLDRLSRVDPLYTLTTLREFREPGQRMARLVVVNDHDLYVLDVGNQVVERLTLNEMRDATERDPNPVARAGQQLSNLVLGNLIGMTWVPPGGERQNGALLILDSARNLLQFDPNWGLQTLPIADKELWRDPQLISSFRGNFYILDPQLNQLLRYRPTAEGYTNPAENYFAADALVDLGGAVDIAIDGHVWILYANGIVQKFLDGRQVQFQLVGHDEPLRAPTALFVSQEDSLTQHLYIADAGRGRIVEYDKEGVFVRQFRLAEGDVLQKLRSFHVNEIEGYIYLLADDALYVTDLPLLPSGQ